MQYATKAYLLCASHRSSTKCVLFDVLLTGSKKKNEWMNMNIKHAKSSTNIIKTEMVWNWFELNVRSLLVSHCIMMNEANNAGEEKKSISKNQIKSNKWLNNLILASICDYLWFWLISFIKFWTRSFCVFCGPFVSHLNHQMFDQSSRNFDTILPTIELENVWICFVIVKKCFGQQMNRKNFTESLTNHENELRVFVFKRTQIMHFNASYRMFGVYTAPAHAIDVPNYLIDEKNRKKFAFS